MSSPKKTYQSPEEKGYHSYHVFLLPFKWKGWKGNEEVVVSTNEIIKEMYLNKDLTKYWDTKKIDDIDKTKYQTDFYNEFTYFYDFVRDALYDFSNKTECLKGNIDDEQILHHFELKTKSGKNTYRIDYKWEVDKNVFEDKHYILDIEDVILNLYSTGVGLLSFHLRNNDKDKCTPDDILQINEFGRRLYPQFVGIGNDGTKEPKKKFLATKITIKTDVDDKSDDFSNYDKWNETLPVLKKNYHALPKFVTGLLPNKINGKAIKYSSALDDRMFVLSWYGNDLLSQSLGRFNPEQNRFSFLFNRGNISHEKDHFNYQKVGLSKDFWYKYIFVDPKDRSIQNDIMQDELLKKHTYDRWGKYSTLYGVSRYSFVGLTGTHEHLNQDFINAGFLPVHVRTMYYKIVELSLVQRATILKFSDEVSNVSSLKQKENDTDIGEQTIEKIRELYRQYIRFVNKIYFREVTAQEQGIELYDMVQKKMRIERDVKDLDAEINELHNYATLLEDKIRIQQENLRIEQENEKKEQEKARQRENEEQTKILNRLQLIGALFLIPSFVTGFFGMNIFGDGLITTPQGLIYTVLVLIGTISLVYIAYKELSSKVSDEAKIEHLISNKERVFDIVVLLIILFMFLPFFMFAFKQSILSYLAIFSAFLILIVSIYKDKINKKNQ